MFAALLRRQLLAAALPPRLRLLTPVDHGAGGAGRTSGTGRGRRGLRRGVAALRHRNYRLYMFGQILSLVGTWMQSVSEPWLVLQLGGSPLQLGLVLALEFAPSTLLAPLGGVLADRIDKRRALVATQVAAAVQALVLFGLTASGLIQIWHIYLLALSLGVINAVNMPIRQAFAAELVPREDLINAIALNSATFNAARVIGPAIAGVTLALWGTAVNFGINAVSYGAVLVALIAMDPIGLYRAHRPDHFPSVRQSLGEGVSYALRTPSVLWPLVLLFGMSTFGMNFQTLLPLFARNTLDIGAHGYGLLYAAMGAGSLIGSLSLAFSGSRRPLIPLIIGGGVFFVAFEVLLGLNRAPLLAYGLVVIIGLSSMLMINTINVAVQYGVPDELRGRVMSLYVLVFAGSGPIGGLFAGAMAQAFGAPTGFIVGAAIAALFLALVAWQVMVRGVVTLPALQPSRLPLEPGAGSSAAPAGEPTAAQEQVRARLG